jgi:hypothetical protein
MEEVKLFQGHPRDVGSSASRGLQNLNRGKRAAQEHFLGGSLGSSDGRAGGKARHDSQ